MGHSTEVTLDDILRRCVEIMRSLGLDPPPLQVKQMFADQLTTFIALTGMETRYAHWSFAQARALLLRRRLGWPATADYVTNAIPATIPVSREDALPLRILATVDGAIRAEFMYHNRHFGGTRPDLVQFEMREHAHMVDRLLADPDIDPGVVRDTLTAAHGLRLVREFPQGKRGYSLLSHIAAHSPSLTDWQRDLVRIVDREMEHFAPQIGTRILQAGWAAYWTPIILEALLLDDRALRDQALFQYKRVVQRFPNYQSGERLNPAFIGKTILTDVERRWREQETATLQEPWFRENVSAKEQLFALARRGHDTSVLRAWLTRENAETLGLVREVTSPAAQKVDVAGVLFDTPKGAPIVWDVVDAEGWQAVRDVFLLRVGFGDWPRIAIADTEDEELPGALVLEHIWDVAELDSEKAEATLRHVQNLWAPGAVLNTRKMAGDKPLRFECDSAGKVTLDADVAVQPHIPMGY